DQRRQSRSCGRPFHHALSGWHESQATLRLLAEQPEIGRGVADAEDALPTRVDPAPADAAADEMPRHRAEPLAIEVAQIDDIDGHGGIVSRTMRVQGRGLTMLRSGLDLVRTTNAG